MGIVDRARDALRPTNAIGPAPDTPAPAAPGYWFSSTAVHPARRFERAADAAAAFNETPAQDHPTVISALPDGGARCVATTFRMDRKAGVPGYEKSVGDMDREFAAAYEAARRATRGPAEAAPGHAPGDGRRPACAAEPESIAKAYYVEEKDGERRYFDDYKRKALAMRATDTSISTRREDLNTIRAMLEIAQARGWHSIEIRGTAEFRREAWIEAAARGLQGRGFAASDLDRQEADRRRAERGPANEVRAQAGAGQAPKPQAPAPSKEAAAAAPQRSPVPGSQGGSDPDRQEADRPQAGRGPSTRVRAQTSVGHAPEPQAPRAPSRDAPAAAAPRRSPAPGTKAATASPAPEAGRNGEAGPSLADHRKVVRDTQKELSPDGRLMMAALAEKIDRQMDRHGLEIRAQMKAFVALELVKKESAEGPIVLSAEHRRAAAAPEPTQAAPKPDPAAIPRRSEPDAPRRSLGR